MKLLIKRLLAAFLLCLTAFGESQLFVDTDLPYAGQAGWSASIVRSGIFEPGPYNSASLALGAKVDGTATLLTTFPAGTYRMWFLMGNSTASITMGSAVGDGYAACTPTNSATTQAWCPSDFTSSIPFSEIVTSYTNAAGGTTTLKVYGIYITSDLGEAPLGQSAGSAATGLRNSNWQRSSYAFVQTTAPTTTNSTSFEKYNLLPNSSFELPLNGWTGSRKHYGYFSGGVSDNMVEYMYQGLTNDAYTGNYSAFIGDRGFRFTLYSPPMRMRGTNEWRAYTLSCWAKGTVGFTLTLTHNFGNIGGSFPSWTSISAAKSPTASWARYAVTGYMCLLPNRDLYAQVAASSSTGTNYVLVDDLQVEEGEITDWAPANTAEFGIDTSKNGGIFDVGETRQFNVKFYNTGAATTRRINYEVRDWMNRLVTSGAQTFAVPTGGSTNAITLSTSNMGFSRIMAWADEQPSFRSETTFVVEDIPNTLTLTTNTFWGTHPNISYSIARSNVAWGFPSARSLSPAEIFRWNRIEGTNDVFGWWGYTGQTYISPDYPILSATNGIEILASLDDKAMPTWAKTGGTGNSFADDATERMYWSNYVFSVVDRYKPYIHYWEDINEGYAATGMTDANMANLAIHTAAAIKSADANAFYVHGPFYNATNDTTDASGTWALLDATTQSYVDAVSAHMYPNGSNADDNVTDAAGVDTDHGKYKKWLDFKTWSGVTELWNTESGIQFVSPLHTEQSGWVSECSGLWWAMPWWKSYEWQRTAQLSSEAIMRAVFRSIGWGFTRFYYYDSRQTDGGYQSWNSQYGPIDWGDNPTTIAGTLLTAINKYPSPVMAGRGTNDTYVEGHCWAQGSRAFLACWTQDRTNRVMTTTNAAIGVYDLQWNLIQTNSTSIKVGRTMNYWISDTLTTNQLLETFINSSAAKAAGTIAPVVSIDVAPHGVVDAKNLPLRWKWHAVDEEMINSSMYPKMVLTRYRIPSYTGTGGYNAWSAWGLTDYVEVNELPASGTWKLEVQAKDIEGNTSASVYSTDSGPDYGNPTGGDVNFGTLNVNTVN